MLEAHLASDGILASYIPRKALIDALLLRIEGVYVQLVATDVACIGTVEQSSIVVPAKTRLRIALSATAQRCRQTDIAQLHGQRANYSRRYSNYHPKRLSVGGRGAHVVSLMPGHAGVSYFQRHAIVTQLGQGVVGMLQPPLDGHIVLHGVALQLQRASCGHK